MPAPIEQPAIYQKKSGIISISDDRKSVLWTPQGEINPNLKLDLAQVANLQATPASSSKTMIRILVSEVTPPTPSNGTPQPLTDDAPAPVAYTFSFSARPNMDAMKESLQSAISSAKQKVEEAAASERNKAASSGSDNKSVPYLVNLDDKALLNDIDLQQNLLRQDRGLQRTFQETVIQGGLKPSAFWGSRIHLLRTKAILNSQRKGPYNVLSTIKPTAGIDNKINVSLTREKIHDIFDQYPIVKTAYDESVPGISEGDFWSRFFLSRLFRRLRGERPNPSDQPDLVMDKYLQVLDREQAKAHGLLSDQGEDEDDVQQQDEQDDGEGPRKRAKRQEQNIDDDDDQVPVTNRFIDTYGNEEQVSEKHGNRPDLTMRPTTKGDYAGVVRSINSLSQRMVHSVVEHQQRNRIEHQAPEGATQDEMPLKVNGNPLSLEQVKELALNDLQLEAIQKGIPLNLDNYRNQLGNAKPSSTRNADLETEEMDTELIEASKEERLGEIQAQLRNPFNLEMFATMYQDDMVKASQQVQKAIEAHPSSGNSINTKIPPDAMERLLLTQATACEFLHQFWIEFHGQHATKVNTSEPTNPTGTTHILSGATLNKLAESLRKSRTRFQAVIDTAMSDLDKIPQGENSTNSIQVTATTQPKTDNTTLLEFMGTGNNNQQKKLTDANGITEQGKQEIRQHLEAAMKPTLNAIDETLARYKSALAASVERNSASETAMIIMKLDRLETN